MSVGSAFQAHDVLDPAARLVDHEDGVRGLAGDPQLARRRARPQADGDRPETDRHLGDGLRGERVGEAEADDPGVDRVGRPEDAVRAELERMDRRLLQVDEVAVAVVDRGCQEDVATGGRWGRLGGGERRHGERQAESERQGPAWHDGLLSRSGDLPAIWVRLSIVIYGSAPGVVNRDGCSPRRRREAQRRTETRLPCRRRHSAGGGSEHS